MVLKKDLAILLIALVTVAGLVSAIFAMSIERNRPARPATADTCGNLTCDALAGETNASCPADCKSMTVDPTKGVSGTVARLYSDQIFDGGERWFIDSTGMEYHEGPYPGGQPLTVNGHGYPMPVEGAPGLGRIELRSQNGPGANVVEAWAPFEILPSDGGGAICGNKACELGEDAIKCPADCGSAGSCQVGLECTADAQCGGGICMGAAKLCEITGAPCDNGVCTSIPQRCEMVDPTKPGVCSLSRTPCMSNAECTLYQPACVQKVGTCQQCPSSSTCGNSVCDAGEDVISCPSDCNPTTCVQGARCSASNACGTGACVKQEPGVCKQSGVACGPDHSCPQVQARCVDLAGKRACENTGQPCAQDADCGVTPDSCVVDAFCSCQQVMDADKDGVEDGKDLCPATEAGAAVDANGCADAQVDSDGDGICNVNAVSFGPSACTGKDQCEAVPGKAEYMGCPSALRVSVQVVDTQTKSKVDQALSTRIFDVSDGSCADTIGTNTPLNYGHIFSTCPAENTIILAETNSISRQVSDLISFGATTGPKLVLVESPVGVNGASAYQAFNVTVASNKVYNLGFEVAPANGTTFVQNSYFTKDSRGNFHGSRKETVTGSILEILMPDYSLWTSNQEVYPFVLTSDSDWTVDVCLQAPQGYKVVGDTNCSQVVVANEVKVIEFQVMDLESPEPNMKSTITATRNGKKTTLKNDHKGFRIKAKNK